MGVKCKILLENNIQDVYNAGDPVMGTVKYAIEKPTVFTSVTLSLRGKGFWYWRPVAPKTIYTDSNNLLDQCMDILETEDEKPVTIPAGTFEKQFCFVVPEEIPASFTEACSFISFFVQMEFVKANPLSSPKQFYSDIKTLSGIAPEANELIMNKIKKFTLSRKTMNLITYIQKPFLYAGEDIVLAFEIIKSCSDVPILSSKIELIQCETFNSSLTSQYFLVLKAIKVKYLGENKSKTELKHTYRLSTTPAMATVHSHELRVEYIVRVIVKLPYPHLPIYASLPVAIAEKIDNTEEEKKNIEESSDGQDIREQSIIQEKAKRKIIKEDNED